MTILNLFPYSWRTFRKSFPAIPTMHLSSISFLLFWKGIFWFIFSSIHSVLKWDEVKNRSISNFTVSILEWFIFLINSVMSIYVKCILVTYNNNYLTPCRKYCIVMIIHKQRMWSIKLVSNNKINKELTVWKIIPRVASPTMKNVPIFFEKLILD